MQRKKDISLWNKDVKIKPNNNNINEPFSDIKHSIFNKTSEEPMETDEPALLVPI